MGKVKKILTVGMRLKKGVLHIVSNSVVPGTDVASDLFTFLELWNNKDYGWAVAVLIFMFVPFLFKLAEFALDLCRGKVRENNVAGLLLHLPFVLGLRASNSAELQQLNASNAGFVNVTTTRSSLPSSLQFLHSPPSSPSLRLFVWDSCQIIRNSLKSHVPPCRAVHPAMKKTLTIAGSSSATLVVPWSQYCTEVSYLMNSEKRTSVVFQK